MRGAATKAMSDIVEERQQSRYAPLPPRPCGPQARWLCCSLLTYRPGYSSSLAPRQRARGPAAKCEVISARALSSSRSFGADRMTEVVPSRSHFHSLWRAAGSSTLCGEGGPFLLASCPLTEGMRRQVPSRL